MTTLAWTGIGILTVIVIAIVWAVLKIKREVSKIGA